MSNAYDAAVAKLLKEYGLTFKRFQLTPDQTKITILSLLQSQDLTDVQKSALFITLTGFEMAQQVMKENQRNAHTS